MSEVFLKIVNMSIAASWLVLVVMLLRLVLKKAPKWANVLLWGIVAVRLIFPFSVESALSLIPSTETIPEQVISGPNFDVHTGVPQIDVPVNDYIGDHYFEGVTVPENYGFQIVTALTIAWMVGVTALLIYTAVSYFLLRCKVGTAVLLMDNIFQSENVDSPFVLGIIKPKIYLPFRMDGQNLEHVIAHEQSHIRRKDHWWKPLGFLLLAIHWFNPLMWIGYCLLCRDIELACDEKVIQEMDNESKADYTQALVACSINRRSIAACPLAFGEVGVKERVKSVMNYKKPAFWIIIAAIVICAVVAVCFLTDPKDSSKGALPEIHSHTYVVEEVVYEGGMYSFSVIAGENSPIYAITADMHLTSQKEHGEEGQWTNLGQLEQITLTKENFDNLFQTGGWRDGASAAAIRKNTQNAWRLLYKQECLYYVLQQKNGGLLLAFGYQRPAQNAYPGSFDQHFRWVYNLAIDMTGVGGLIAKSGSNTVPMVSFPKGTIIADHVDSVHWLTIDPGEKECLPFTTWKDGEQMRGFCAAYDAETFEPLTFFLPSGLDPQTYLFQNAVPDRKYIVLATFSTEENAEIYAFGAQFKSNGQSSSDLGTTEVIHGNLKTYYKNPDGTWQLNGHIYQHRLEITGRMPNAAVDSTFVYLSNLKNITFDRAWKAAGFSSNMNDYFSVEDAVLVDWLVDGSVSLPITEETLPAGIVHIDSVSYDIDGDGTQETCTISYVPTPQLFAFEFSAIPQEITTSSYGYAATFGLKDTYELSFKLVDGDLQIQGNREARDPVYFDIAVRDGHIILQCEEEGIFFNVHPIDD